MQKYAFLDRDGTIIWEPTIFPIKSIEQFKFMDGAIEGMKRLVENGYKLVLVTNQPLLGTTEHPRAVFDRIMARIETELAEEGLQFEFVMVCPHAANAGCDCRKPRIGGVKSYLEASVGGFDRDQSFMFGNMKADRGFADNLGIRFIQIRTNKRFVLPMDL